MSEISFLPGLDFGAVDEMVRLTHDLPPLQRRFVFEYLTDQNGRQAAKRAGFSSKSDASLDVQASRLLRNAKVKKAIAYGLSQLDKKCELTAERILRELCAIAFFDPKKIFDEKGELLPLDQIPEEARRALISIEPGEGLGHPLTKYKIRTWDKNRAAELLGKARHIKLFVDSHEHEVGRKLEDILLGQGGDAVAGAEAAA